jgi:hypothetical protein
MLDIAVFDMAEPEPLSVAVFPVGAAEVLLVSLDDGDEVEEEDESAGAAGLLQPSRAKDKQRPRVSTVKRVRMIPSMSGWSIRKQILRKCS